MELLYFYLTVIVQLISVIASAACLAVYLVSHRRTFLFAFWSFLFYFIDVSLIFQDEFVGIATNLESDPLYLTLRSLGSMVSGGGIYISLWLLVCDFVGEKRTVLLAAPGAMFVIGSIAALFLIPSSPLARFAFYSMRTLLLLWIVAFIAFRYITTLDPTERGRMRRHKAVYFALAAGGACIFFEDIASFFYGISLFPATHFEGERNYSEEVLMLICAAASCVSAYRALSLFATKTLPRERMTTSNRRSKATLSSTPKGTGSQSARWRRSSLSSLASTTKISPPPWALRQARRKCTCTTSSKRQGTQTDRTLSRTSGARGRTLSDQKSHQTPSPRGNSDHGGGCNTRMSTRNVWAISREISSSVMSGFAFISPTTPYSTKAKVSGTISISTIR